MAHNIERQQLPMALRVYISLVGIAGAAWLAYLVSVAPWSSSAIVETGLFTLLVIAAGSFPLPVAPRVKADVATAALFGAALLLEPGAAALAATFGIVGFTFLLRYRGDRLRLPWYKYPFNGGATALYVGLASVVFHDLSADGQLLSPAVAAAAATMYMANTVVVTVAASLQMATNPLRFWWMGTRDNGLAELSLLAFGFLGAVAYRESPWTVVALFLPVAIIYVAFSRLARTNTELEDALRRLEALQGQIATNAKLASVGAMSLDMAHQIKNPLAILMGRLETFGDRIEEESPHRRHVDVALNAGWRMSSSRVSRRWATGSPCG